MAIAGRPACTDPHKVDETNTTPKCYDTITCNSSTGLPNLDGVVSGPVTSIDYFQQYLAGSDTAYYVDPNLSPTHQQYRHIQGMTVEILEQLSTDIDVNTNVSTLTGRARVQNFVRPNVGDVITMPLQGGLYMFSVTSVVATAVGRGTSYDISYTMTGEANSSNSNYVTLMDKVTDTLVYDPNVAASGGANPLLSEAEAASKKDLLPYIAGIGKEYFKSFTDPNTGYLMLTRNGEGVYDPHISKFVTSLISMGCVTTNEDVRKIPINEQNRRKYSVYDVMLDRSLLLTSSMCDKFCHTAHSEYDGYRDISSIWTSSVGWVVGDNDTSHGTPCFATPNDWICPDRVNPPNLGCKAYDAPNCYCNDSETNDVKSVYGRTVDGEVGSRVILKDPTLGDTYVFSQAFYDEDRPNMSHIELLVDKYLHNETITMEEMKILMDDVKNWCSHSLYFYGPIAMLLAKYALSTKCTPG